ncbi:MAG: efflux RND transporter permease subunit [Candidatus Lambdaproteobacteria bacterium]|nr:efflux RND transporter permease subunit [Candidatus Lambdaproteobacteria bacterium]
MNLPQLCIQRPVMTTLLMLSFMVAGVFAYFKLPVAAIPRVDFPVIEVTAQLSGANPESMAASVATPLERQFSTISGVNAITSVNGAGSTRVTLQFNLDRDIDSAALDVQSAISTALRKLPSEMTTPPGFRKVNPADFPVLYFSFRSPTLPLSGVNEYADMAAQRISALPGVAQALIFGQQKYAVRVQVNPNAVAAKGIGLDEIQRAVAAADTNLPVGTLSGAFQSFTLQASGQLRRASEYEPLIVANRNGNPVRLRDISRVLDSVEDDEQASWFNGTRSIIVAVYRQPDANTIAVVDKVRELLPAVREQVPASVAVRVLSDRSISIRESVEDVEFTLMLTIALVVLVIFLFLRNITATLIPAIALPISIVGTFAGMYLFGYSIDNISLLALTLSVGFVVDDAIVMLENIVRHVEQGMSPMEAALKGSKEIAFTILSMTLSLVAVFIPVFFMGGMVGRLFREFAVTITMTILISGIVSLTLTPLMCSRLIKPVHADHQSFFMLRWFEDAFNAMHRAYAWSLGLALRHRRIMLATAIATLVASVWLFIVVPKGFFPSEDTGMLFAVTEASQDVSFDAMVRQQREVARIIQEDPAVDGTNSSVGAGGSSTAVNQGRIFITLKPRSERSPAPEVVRRLRPRLARIPGVNVFIQSVQNIRVGGRFAKSEFQYTITGTDFGELQRVAQVMEARMKDLPELRDVTTDLLVRSPQLFVDIDREKAAALNVTSDQIRSTLYSAFGARQVATIYTSTNSYQVILELEPKFREDPQALSHLYVRGSAGQLVPLGALTTFTRLAGPLSINHQAGLPAVTVAFNLNPGTSLGDAVDSIRRLERDQNLPATVNTNFQGTAQVFQEALAGQGILLLAAVYVVFVVLGILYESFLHPITILSGLPSAGLGALLTLLAFKMDLSVIAIIGVVMLIGIVKKNGIMMVDFALDRQRESSTVTAEQAIYDACLIRFRPIMMTTMSAIMGSIPIAVGLGAGAEFRQPLGVAVLGGLLVSQFLTLYITPVVFLYLEHAQQAIRRRKSAPPQLQAA